MPCARCMACSASGLSSMACTIMLAGTAQLRPSASTSKVWVTARVSGRRIEKRVPAPGRLATSTRPPAAAVCAFTTSMPTPRPETAETSRAVLKPETKIRFTRRRSSTRSSAPSRPRARACAAMRSRSSPAPSSAISMAISLPSWRTVSSMLPVSALPAARRAAGASMPCATALRSRCSSGAAICSSTLRSTSMRPPRRSSAARLPSSRALCRTTR